MNVRLFGTAALTCLMAACTASATTIVGQSFISGAPGSGVTVTGNSITFNGGGAFVEQNPGTGSFSGVTGGTLKNLTGGPVVGPTSVSKFATFLGGAVTPIYFDITSIDLGTGTGPCSGAGANTVGNTCTPGVSPFTLTQKNGSVAIDLTLHGVSYDSTGTPLSPTDSFFGTSITVQGVTITSLLAMLGGGGSITSSYQATFSAVAPVTTPEPSAASLLVAGIGLLASSRLIRKYRN